jgi:hypothetical protein
VIDVSNDLKECERVIYSTTLSMKKEEEEEARSSFSLVPSSFLSVVTPLIAIGVASWIISKRCFT